MCNSLPLKQYTTQQIQVTGIPCSPFISYTFYPLGPLQPHYYFLKITYPYNTIGWSFDWGDGTTDNFLYGNHTYSAAGVYTICITATASCGSSTTSCIAQAISKGTDQTIFQVNVIGPNGETGIENQIEAVNDVRIFPNPASNNLYINSSVDIKSVTVLNAVGQQCSLMMHAENDNKYYELSHLSNGIYFVMVNTSKGAIRKKILVEH